MTMLECWTVLGMRNPSVQRGLGPGSVQHQGWLSASLHCVYAVISVRDDTSGGAVLAIDHTALMILLNCVSDFSSCLQLLCIDIQHFNMTGFNVNECWWREAELCYVTDLYRARRQCQLPLHCVHATGGFSWTRVVMRSHHTVRVVFELYL